MLEEMLESQQKILEILSEITAKMEKSPDEKIEIYTVKDVAKIIGCSPTTANALFNREDFPKLKCSKTKKVEKSEFLNWLKNQKTKEK